MNNGEEKLKEQKAGNPIFILIIFAAIIGFIFYVPDIYKKYNAEFSKFLGGGNSKEEDKGQKEDDKSPISAYYQLGSRSTLKFNEITLTDISLSPDKTLTFTINSENQIDLDELYYYAEFYKERKTFVGRRLLHGKVPKKLTLELDLANLDVDTTTYMTVSLITDDGIQPIEDSGDESGLTSIRCTKGTETFDYDFYLKKLAKTTYKYTYENENMDELSRSLLEAQKKEKAYNEYTGVTAHITENDTSYIFLSEFDYANVTTFQKLGDPRIFDKNTLNSVVKFKMDAEGFDCDEKRV